MLFIVCLYSVFMSLTLSENDEILSIILMFVCFSQMTPLEEEVPRSEMICILAVPATFLAQDLLQFLTPVE